MTDRPDGGTDHTVVDEHDLDDPDWPRSPITGVPRPDPGIVCSVAKALECGDEVMIGDRSRSLTVLGFERQENPGVLKTSDYPYFIVWLRGNGTEYRLRWSHRHDNYPHMHTESQLETRETFSIKHGEKVNKTRSTCSGERVQWIKPVDVEEKELTRWALARNIMEVEDGAE